jgi:hypothetical protein
MKSINCLHKLAECRGSTPLIPKPASLHNLEPVGNENTEWVQNNFEIEMEGKMPVSLPGIKLGHLGQSQPLFSLNYDSR